MKATLKAFTALTVILALQAGAGAFSPNMPPPNLTIVPPTIVRPAIGPRVDASRLAPKRQRSRKNTKRRAAKQSRAPKNARRPTGIQKAADRPRVAKLPLLPEHPPLPLPKPDSSTLADNKATRGLRDAGPQPEPPTKELSGLKPGRGFANPERLRDRVAYLRLLEEFGRLRDLKESLEGNRAVDESSIGGGSRGRRHGPSGFDWKGLVPEGQSQDGPQNDNIWKAGLPGSTAYNPGADRDGGFTPPWRRGQSGDRDMPGFGSTPGRAGAGLPGQGGETSQDGGKPRDYPKDYYPDDDTEFTPDESGGGFTETVTLDSGDGGTTTHVYHYGSPTDWPSNPDRTYTMYVGPTREAPDMTFTEEEAGPDMTFTLEEAEGGDGPDSQPAPDQPVGDSMPCVKGSRGCGPTSGLLSYQPSKWDKVSQPGKGDEQGGGQGFRASVAERRSVVTNPVDPENYIRTGGGSKPRPIEHVTQPGGGEPGGPRP